MTAIYLPDLDAMLAKQAEILESTGRTLLEALAVAVKSLAGNVAKKPARYLAYGPYWWAVKAIFTAGGEDFGPETDEAKRKEYSLYTDDGELLPYATLLAAENFKDHYNATFFQGTREIALDADGEDIYTLTDSDMEARIGAVA